MNRIVSILGWAAIAFGLAAAGVQLSQLVMHVFGRVDSGNVDTMTQVMTAPQSPEELLAPLISAAPFGQRIVHPDSGSRPGASLDWTLRAIRLATPASGSTATISISGGAPKIYRLGDTIDDYAELIQIDARSVRLRSGAAEETLSFPVPETRARLSGIYAAKATEYATVPGTSQASGISQSVAVTESIRTQIQANPQTLLDGLDISPSAEGYIVGTNTAAALLLAGLKPGDRVVKVNGSSVGNIENDRQLFEQAVQAGQARVEIIRDGRALILSFPLR